MARGRVHYSQVRPRLLLLLWHLADRWGRVTPDGVRIPLRLRHGMLAELLAVRRPSATAALQQLISDGLVRRGECELIPERNVTERLDDLLRERVT